MASSAGFTNPEVRRVNFNLNVRVDFGGADYGKLSNKFHLRQSTFVLDINMLLF